MTEPSAVAGWNPLHALGWGIVGPGQIGAVFADCIQASGSGRVAAVSGRNAAHAAAFCAAHGGEPAPSLAALLARDDVGAVYVATPHSAHAGAVRAALAAGKAVLCEKPMTTSAAETRALVEEAEARGGLLVEGWMYRHHPQIARLLALLREGAIGRPLRFESVFGFEAPYDPEQRLWNPALGGGAILDIGGYPLSLALSCAAAAAGATGFEPGAQLVRATSRRAPSGVDARATLELTFPSGFTAGLTVALDEALGETAVVQGTVGSLALDTPFLVEGRRDGTLGRLRRTAAGGERETEAETEAEELVAASDAFSLEARAIAVLVAEGRRAADLPAPLLAPVHSVALAALLERWRDEVGNQAADPAIA